MAFALQPLSLRALCLTKKPYLCFGMRSVYTPKPGQTAQALVGTALLGACFDALDEHEGGNGIHRESKLAGSHAHLTFGFV
jgi:hypothetical protein